MKGVNSRRFGTVKYWLATGMVALLCACSTTKPPTDKMAQTRLAIDQADQAGAGEYAPLDIRQAKKKLAKAQDLIKDEKYEKAGRLADEAMVDAELAEEKSLSEKAQKAVKELRKSIQLLKEEIENNQKNQ